MLRALACLVALLLARGAGAAPSVDSDTAVYEELLELTGVYTAARVSAQEVVDRLRTENPVVPESVWTNFGAKISARDTLTPLYVPIYVRHITPADAQDLLAFYRSALGQHWLDVLPRIQRACREDAERWAGTIVADLLGDETGRRTEQAASSARHGARAELVHELLRASGALTQARQMMSLAIDRLERAPQANELSPSFWMQARERLTDQSALLRLWTPAYARYLNEQDLRGLIDFYRSPLGERYVAALPAIQSESLEAATQLANTSARRAIREVLGPLPQWRLQHPAQPEQR